MKNISKWFKTGTAGITGIATMDGYRRTINNEKKVSESDRLLQETIKQHQSAVKEISDKERYLDDRNTDLIATYGRIKEKCEWIGHDLRNLTKQASIENNNKTIQGGVESVNKSTSDLMKEINELMVKVDWNSGSKGNSFNSVYDLFASYSSTQLGAMAHIFIYIITYLCISDILITYYGNYLIVYFKLEEKYPSLAKWIKIRRKFQGYSICLHISFVIIIILFAIYVDLIALNSRA